MAQDDGGLLARIAWFGPAPPRASCITGLLSIRGNPVRSDLIPDNEVERLEAVRRYEILDTPPDGAFDRVTRLAARLFEVPISIVSIVDEDRIWFKSHYGLDAEQIDRAPGLCASAILQGDLWLVNDATVDPRTLTNPLVRGELGLRFYAGVPLVTRDGYRLGTFNIIDVQPRTLTPEDEQTLRDLAAIVVDELELRLAARQIVNNLRVRRREGMELHDGVVQDLAAAKLSVELGEWERAGDAVSNALQNASRIATDLLLDATDELEPGGLIRRTDLPAVPPPMASEG